MILRQLQCFAYPENSSPRALRLRNVSHLVQTELSTMRRPISSTFWQLGVLAVLSVWIYWSTLSHLLGQWWHDPDFSFGFIVPLFSVFLVWQDRHRLARISTQPAWSGLAVLALGLALLVVGQMGAELFLARLSILFVLAGLIILFWGWNLFRAMLFPWAFLVLMIPIPNIILNQITFPLQLLASKVAAGVLSAPLFGKPLVPVLREGNVIHLPSMDLQVAKACSGIRSLMSLTALAIIYGYLMEKRLWVRCVLAAASVPIAVVANSGRIVGTALVAQYWDPSKAEGYYHESWGWIVFVISLVLLYALHSLMVLLWPARTTESPGAKK
jgi:exosortase